MTDLQSLLGSNIIDFTLIGALFLVTIIIVVLGFFYLRANRNFDFSLKSIGRMDDLAEINKEILASKTTLEALKHQEKLLRDAISQHNSDQKAVEELRGEITQLGETYSRQLAALKDMEVELAKSQAFKDFVEQHKTDQLSAIDELLEQREAKLQELSEQMADLQVGANIGKTLDSIFTDYSNNASVASERKQLQAEIEHLKQQTSKFQEELDDIQEDINTNLLNSSFNQALSQLQESFNQSLEHMSNQLPDLMALSHHSLALQESIKKQEQRDAELLAKIQVQEQQAEQLQSSIAAQERREKQLQSSIKTQEQNDSLLQASIRENELHAKSLRVRISEQEKHEKQLQERINEQELRHEQLQESITEKKVRETMLQENIQSQLQQQEQLEKTIASLKQQQQELSSSQQQSVDEANEAYRDLEAEPSAISDFRNSLTQSVPFIATEAQAIAGFKRFLLANGFFYSSRVINAFHTSLKVQSVNPLSVLAGLSGTGKTQLALQYAKYFGFYCEHVAVQPRWDSKDDLLGFYNFLEKSYQPTPLVKALYYFHQHSNEKKCPMLMVVLDEMNLARVEYYFSEFLSKLELREKQKEKSEIFIGSQLNPRSFFVGSNVVIVGTMNDDESTYSLSDKVLDRANVLHFGKPPEFPDEQYAQGVTERDKRTIWVTPATFNEWCQTHGAYLDEEITANINLLNEALDLVGKAFGYRVHNSITKFILLYPGVKENPELAKLALADQIEMKIIPKLAGLEQNDKSSECIDKIQQVLSFTGDQDLINGFSSARDSYESNGMFLWRGITRNLD